MTDSKKRDENKITIVGQARVGKSSIINRIAYNRFSDFESSTIGAAFCAKKHNGKLLHFWDTAGQERFQALVPMYLRNSKVVLVVFDTTSLNSFENIKNHWIKFIEETTPDSKIIIVANKCDLKKHRKTPPKKECSKYAKSIGAKYIETSAKENINIDNLLNEISKSVDDVNTNCPDSFLINYNDKEENFFGKEDPSILRNRCFNCNFI